MKDRGKVHHWSAYVFGEIGSQELDDFGEAIRSCVAPAEVRLLAEAMADRARSYFGDGDDGEWAALGMLDGADAEIAGLQPQRTPRVRRVGVKSAGVAGETAPPTAMSA
jgi:hypothetical protein